KSIRGVVRYETLTERPADEAWLSSARAGHGCYPPTEHGERTGVLTWRQRETDSRVIIPREQWAIERLPIPEAEHGVAGPLPPLKLKVRGGLRPGYLYELVCEAEGPIVQGLGFAAVRDFVSFLRHETGAGSPLRGAINRTHGFGVSQSGRFLRHFTYE